MFQKYVKCESSDIKFVYILGFQTKKNVICYINTNYVFYCVIRIEETKLVCAIPSKCIVAWITHCWSIGNPKIILKCSQMIPNWDKQKIQRCSMIFYHFIEKLKNNACQGQQIKKTTRLYISYHFCWKYIKIILPGGFENWKKQMIVYHFY